MAFSGGNMRWRFKEKFSLEYRKKESATVNERFPDKIPIIVQKSFHSTLPDLNKYKMMVPYEMTVAQFTWILRQKLQLNANKSIYLFINKNLPQSSAVLGELYHRHQDEDGFLYIMYSGENTFG